MDTALTRRPMQALIRAWAMVLLAGACVAGDGEEELQAGIDLHAQGDYVGALRKWRAAAEKGDAAAMFNIGTLYDNGQGVEQDHAAAMRWYRKAAEQGDADAKAALQRLRNK